MKVLVGVDGSSNSLATVAFVGRVLSAQRDQLVLAYVSPTLPYLGDDQLDPAVATRAQTAMSSAVFDEAMTRLPAEWRSRTERIELSGAPGASLLRSAEEHRVELIAVGFRGTGLFERFLLGSVSRAVVHSASVSVLVVKTVAEASEQPAGTADGTLRVLAAYDGADVGEKLAAVAGRFTWPASTAGYVMTVVPPMFVHQLPAWLEPIQRDPDVQAMAEAWRKDHEQQLAQAGDELRTFQRQLPGSFQTTEPIVVQGRPAEQILATVDAMHIDLTVVGGRGRGAVERLLIGSTSSQIVNEASCSVLVAR